MLNSPILIRSLKLSGTSVWVGDHARYWLGSVNKPSDEIETINWGPDWDMTEKYLKEVLKQAMQSISMQSKEL